MGHKPQVRPITRLGRKKYMKFTIGKEEPTEFDVMHITAAQILVANPRFFNFRKEGLLRIFGSDVDWIPNKDDLKRMINGGLVPCNEFGVNSSRVETSYRYCYEGVYYGHKCDFSAYKVPEKINEVEFEKYAEQVDIFYLVLVNFGKYYWNEETQ